MFCSGSFSHASRRVRPLTVSVVTLVLACLIMAVDARANNNDRYVVASFTNGTSTVSGGVQATLALTVLNDINNLQSPNHFIQWVQVTAPVTNSGALVFTGSGSNGAYTASDFTPSPGWHVLSIAGNVITFVTASTDYTFTAGTSRTFLIKVHTPAATACPGASYPWGVIANQSTSGGKGNTYPYRPPPLCQQSRSRIVSLPPTWSSIPSRPRASTPPGTARQSF